MKSKSAEKIKLTSYDELFGVEESCVEGTYTKVPLIQLRPFKNHPFKVLDDEKMQETVESVIQHGVIQPGIVRPCADGYERGTDTADGEPVNWQERQRCR